LDRSPPPPLKRGEARGSFAFDITGGGKSLESPPFEGGFRGISRDLQFFRDSLSTGEILVDSALAPPPDPPVHGMNRNKKSTFSHKSGGRRGEGTTREKFRCKM
jgi:hypothetical protein